MKYRPGVVLLAAVACGRVGFEALPTDAPGADASTGDAPACGKPLCLDPTFGSAGIVTIDVGQVDNATFASRAIAERPDGRLVVAGKANGDGLVVGLTESGARDPAFGSAGVITFDAGGSDDEAMAVAVVADGELAIGGSTDGNDAAIVARVGSAGIDTTWGGLGFYRVSTAGGAGAFNGVLVDSLGRVAAGGQSVNPPRGFDLTAAWFTATGALDTTFVNGGEQLVDLHGADEFGLLAATDTAGNYYLVGQTYVPPFMGAIVRLASNGALDSTFAGTGSVAYSGGSGDTRFYDLALDGSGRLVAAGIANDDLIVVRFDGSGSIDTSFGTLGAVRIDRGSNETLYASAILPGGRIATGGTSAGSAVLAVLDGTGSTLSVDALPLPAPARVSCMIVDHAGRLLVMGQVPGAGTDIFVARFRAS